MILFIFHGIDCSTVLYRQLVTVIDEIFSRLIKRGPGDFGLLQLLRGLIISQRIEFHRNYIHIHVLSSVLYNIFQGVSVEIFLGLIPCL